MSEQTTGKQSKNVTLKDGFERDGTTIKQVQVRRPTWGDITAGEEAADRAQHERLKNVIVTNTLLQRCADLAPEEVQQLTAEDAERISNAMGPTSTPQTRTSSAS